MRIGFRMVEFNKEPIYLIGVIMNITFVFRELKTDVLGNKKTNHGLNKTK